MHIDAVLTQEDLVALVAQLTPVRIRLGDDGDLLIHEASEVTLVPGIGLRIVCSAKLHWPVLGVSLPVTLRSLTLLLTPMIAPRPKGNALVFKLHVEHADFAGIPTIVDERVTDRVNKALAEDRAELVWDFAKTLSHAFALPSLLEPLDSLGLTVALGEVRVTAAAMILAVSFHANVTRHAEPQALSA